MTGEQAPGRTPTRGEKARSVLAPPPDGEGGGTAARAQSAGLSAKHYFLAIGNRTPRSASCSSSGTQTGVRSP